MRPLLSVGAAVIAVAMAACAQPTSPSGKTSLANTFDSPEALSQAVLQALAGRDLARLQAMALSEAEFREHVWPELPTSQPERNVPFDYAWGQLKQRSDGSLESTLGRYGGRSLRFVRSRFAGETTQYASFLVLRESEIIAADETGREWVLNLYGSALLKDGRYKVFSYVTD